MTNIIQEKEHYNLYYIFKEDKEKRSLSNIEIDKLCREIIIKFKEKSFS